ncbi:MAG: thermonuclease family protein [Opitutaceae bacterium]|jgi:endonuclease YncB( thermonuclease family)|nr:thermonuclease family protein [Opitutaceae bacterium]MBP9912961.1 thermonuclease family protein [Opitutaceae bacterium]
MPQTEKLVVPETYAALKQAVLAVVLKGRAEIDRAWLLTYHETGRLIHEHLLLNKERANYGGQVFPKLAEDTGTSSRSLYEFTQFYRCFPIVRDRAQLGWSHYRLLCQVPDPARRQALLAETIKRGWTSPQLEEQVRALAEEKPDASEAAKDVTPPKLLKPKCGMAGVCKIIADGEGLAVDLGFACYLRLPSETKLKADLFVRVTAAGVEKAEEATKADLFTYAAEILKVVDGDTLWVRIFLRPDQWVKQKLRFRDLDCPELSTPEGKVAKRFVDGLIARTQGVKICTTKPDKYDRYLADVFLTLDDGSEIFLNNELLANGQAVLKREWEFGDWGEEG